MDISLFESFLHGERVVHINHSKTCQKGVVRGLHLQKPPFQEIKVIQAIKGKVFDVAVDVRKGSDTFLKHVCIELSSDRKNGVIIPKGVAHGFQVLEDDTELIYIHTERYDSDSEIGFNIRDPKLKIVLPLPISFSSIKDNLLPFIADDFEGI